MLKKSLFFLLVSLFVFNNSYADNKIKDNKPSNMTIALSCALLFVIPTAYATHRLIKSRTTLDEKMTSEEWQKKYPLVRVCDPDGWDRTEGYDHDWFVKKITKAEYRRRVALSTCRWDCLGGLGGVEVYFSH